MWQLTVHAKAGGNEVAGVSKHQVLGNKLEYGHLLALAIHDLYVSCEIPTLRSAQIGSAWEML